MAGVSLDESRGGKSSARFRFEGLGSADMGVYEELTRVEEELTA